MSVAAGPYSPAMLYGFAGNVARPSVSLFTPPTLSLQLYAQPFVSTGSFSNWREIALARSPDVAARFAAYRRGSNPDGFNFKQFNSNAVVRWEYRAGSTLFLVWQQGRARTEPGPDTFEFSRDYRNLFRLHPINTVLIKVAYWLNP